jgi:iron complex transport system substrate-binding protein
LTSPQRETYTHISTCHRKENRHRLLQQFASLTCFIREQKSAHERRFVQRGSFAKRVGLAALVPTAATILLCAGISGAQTQSAFSQAVPAREVTDETGRTVRIPQTLHRVVSLAPSLTETMYALGLQDLLVGDTDYCDFPPDARYKPKVGGAVNPSLETIVELHPDLVLVIKSLNRLDTVESLAHLGIPSYAVDPHSVAEIISSTRHLAAVMGAPEAGDALAKELETRLAAVQHRVASLPRRRALFIVWTQPLISIGKQTFIADALQYAGAVSVVDSPENWPKVSLEEVARIQPEFLVFPDTHSETTPLNIEALADLPGWRILDAVRGRHYAKTTEAMDRPVPRIVSAIEDLAKQFHPEAFAAGPETDTGPGEQNEIDRKKSAPPPPPPGFSLSPPVFGLIGSSLHLAEECACAR